MGGVYTIVPAAYAWVSVAAFLLFALELDWFGAAFLTFGPHSSTTNATAAVAGTGKTFCGRPIRSMRQYLALVSVSFVNALLNTFYNELMRPFWFNAVNPDDDVRHTTLRRDMNGSIGRLFKANLEAEVYLKFAHVLSLFLSLVDIWIILAQLCGSALGSTAVIVWHFWGSLGKPRGARLLDLAAADDVEGC